MPPILRLRPGDPLAVALVDLPEGAALGGGVFAREPIPRGHKVALRDVARGDVVRKLASPIGIATAAIPAGTHVHSHNLAFAPLQAGATGRLRNNPEAPAPTGATFNGYVRADGRVGTRNVLLVMSTVNCSATVTRRIAERFRATVDLSEYPSVDGVVALTHQHGCSVRGDGPGMDMLRLVMAGYARHPNVAGVLLVGLGCEDNQAESFLEAAGLNVSGQLAVRVIQQEGGTTATIAAGVAALRDMLPLAAAATRVRVPASHLVLGLQCGGSDGFSTLTANPALGHAADRLVAEGGTVILSETPELSGAEHLLLERAPDPAVAARLIGLLDWWRVQAVRDGGTLDNNPSPGNKAGGITTILEKSLGALAKAGTSPLRDVVGYARAVTTPGLVFMDSPGYDPVSATGQVAGGANLICFTTGRGSCFGCAPTPSLKVSTTSELFARMRDDMDLDAGTILTGEAIADVGDRIFQRLLDTASGRQTASEILGYGEEEFAPWTPGLTY